MKTAIIVALLCPIFWHSLYAINEQKQKTSNTHQLLTPKTITKKKKILIFTSKGGYGHTAACNSLTQLLSADYDITITNPFEQLLYPFDFVKKLSRNSMNGEQLYNWLLQKGWLGFTNVSCKYFAPTLIRASNQAKEKIILDYVVKENPDLVISVIPFLNLPISNAAHKLDVPFLLITTDGDLSQWILGLKHMVHKKFVATIGFETSKTRPKLRACGIKNQYIKHTGFPIRADFLEKKDKNMIRARWNIPENKFVIMIMMGGTGSTATYRYAQKIAKLDFNAHLLVCIGRNEKLKNKIAQIPLKKGISLSIIPFTTRVSDLMTVSDLLITKPGPGSINEALYRQLPMLIDKSTTTLFWEDANIELAIKNHWGDVIYSLDSTEELIKKYMYDKNYYQSVKSALKTYALRDFSKNIKIIITKLCPPQQQPCPL